MGFVSDFDSTTGEGCVFVFTTVGEEIGLGTGRDSLVRVPKPSFPI